MLEMCKFNYTYTKVIAFFKGLSFLLTYIGEAEN